MRCGVERDAVATAAVRLERADGEVRGVITSTACQRKGGRLRACRPSFALFRRYLLPHNRVQLDLRKVTPGL